ncbi:MAG: stage III sporulation protein AF [Oscillospiraceae bacterium]|nr:stage III sporulation protein AF [Oscillospiraceae bacterium]
MIQGARQWLLGVVLTAFAGGLARQLAPKGRERALVGLVCGLLLTLALLEPLAELEWAAAARDWPGPAQAALAESYRQEGQAALSAVIAEKTEAYILDKADRLGLRCAVEVAVSAGESGIPLPDAVTIRGGYSAALAACIEEEVGVPPEKQIWLEEETWTRESEQSP